MSKSHESIVVEAAKLAARLPLSTVELVAKTIEQEASGEHPSTRIRISQALPNADYRSRATKFFDRWKASAPDVSPAAVALALRTAAHVDHNLRQDQQVELVWTGPDADAVPFRRTEQAILQVLDSAQSRISLVSFAVYQIPHVRQALVAAARRGIQIKVIVETPHLNEGEQEYNTLKALGGEVAACSTVYYWPTEKRKPHGSGKQGLLHVKCAVADARLLFLSSANLTEYAFSINMELGVLITGGQLPRQVEENFDRMIQQSILRPV